MASDITFSIFMCARNAEKTINKAINSVISQNCKAWELIIVDNGSEDNTWLLIQAAMEQDLRIKGIHLEHGIGWAKGASVCMEYAAGKYMTFLAADDFFTGSGSLSAVEEVLSENPDMVFCGHMLVQLNDTTYTIGGGIIPEKKIYLGEDKIFELFDIMNTLYYNSFFHFISLELLRKNNIDFYEPFYGDCEGVTEAICRSSKIIVIDQAIYALTVNTSQTQGVSVWTDYVMQWKSVKRAVVEEGKYDKDRLHYIAIRIFNNHMSVLKQLCYGEKVRNKEMNDITISNSEKLEFMEKLLGQEENVEMFYFAGRQYYARGLFEYVKHVYANCIKSEERNSTVKVKWIDKLIRGLCSYDGEQFVDRTEFCRENFEDVHAVLCNENNEGMFGYELISVMQPFVTPDVEELWLDIFGCYINWMQKKIYELLFMAIEIKKRGRLQEVVAIIKESTTLLQQISPYLTESDLQQITADLKMVIGK